MKPAFVITISKKKVRGRGPAWVVSKPRCALSATRARRRTGPVCGEIVEWRVTDPGVSAYLQFTDMYLFENVRGSKRLTDDKTAVVTKAHPLFLKLRGYQDQLNRRKLHYYAVWIQEDAVGTRTASAANQGGGKATARQGTGFALGHTLNPPPEINVGP